MLKSGKLKLADDMIVTAQEATNKAETVFTIYDDVTNTEIASGPIGGSGGGSIHPNFVNNVNSNPLYYTYDITGTTGNLPEQSKVTQITINSEAWFGVEAEENPSMNYKFTFNDPNNRVFDAAYDSEAGMYAITTDIAVIYNTENIIVTFVEEPK